jgi:hypothetical protein
MTDEPKKQPLTFEVDGVRYEIEKVHGLVEPKPLTEEDLRRIERCLPPVDPADGETNFAVTLGHVDAGNDLPVAEFDTDDVYRLVVEVRRLRAEQAEVPVVYGSYGTAGPNEPRVTCPGEVQRVWVNGQPYVPEKP